MVHNLPQDVVAMRDAIQGVVFWNSEVLKHAADIAGRNWAPHPTDWPDSATPVKDRDVGWPRLLDDLHEDLPKFWTAVEASHAALDGLSERSISLLDASAGEAWSVRVRRTLDDVSKWCHHSRHWIVERNRVGHAVAAFLTAVDAAKQTCDGFDPTEQHRLLLQFDDDLRALRRTPDPEHDSVGSDNKAAAHRPFDLVLDESHESVHRLGNKYRHLKPVSIRNEGAWTLLKHLVEGHGNTTLHSVKRVLGDRQSHTRQNARRALNDALSPFNLYVENWRLMEKTSSAGLV